MARFSTTFASEMVEKRVIVMPGGAPGRAGRIREVDERLAAVAAGWDKHELAAHLTTHGVRVQWDEHFPGHARFYAWDRLGNRLEFLQPL